MSENSPTQRTPEIVIRRFFCPAESCRCSRKGGRLVLELKCEKGDKIEARTACPNNKSCVLLFTV